MEPADDHQSLKLVVVTSTEWRNLCARRSIRMMHRRAVNGSDGDRVARLHEAFASAPMTNLDAASDVLVLQLRGDWPAAAQPHPCRPGEVVDLHLDDVRSHHAVDVDLVDYFRQQAAAVGCELSDIVYDDAWAAWVRREATAAALEAAKALAASVWPDLPWPPTAEGDIGWELVAGRVVGGVDRVPDDAISLLLQHAMDIDDAARGIRGTEAYLLAAVVEWVEFSVGEDLGEDEDLLRLVLDRSRTLDLDDDSLGAVSRAFLQAVRSIFDSAFTEDIAAPAVGLLIALIAGIRRQQMTPVQIRAGLERLGVVAPGSRALGAVVVTGTLGPELAFQLMRSAGEGRSGTGAVRAMVASED